MKLINKARSLKQSQTDIDHLLWQDVDLNKPPSEAPGGRFQQSGRCAGNTRFRFRSNTAYN